MTRSIQQVHDVVKQQHVLLLISDQKQTFIGFLWELTMQQRCGSLYLFCEGADLWIFSVGV